MGGAPRGDGESSNRPREWRRRGARGDGEPKTARIYPPVRSNFAKLGKKWQVICQTVGAAFFLILPKNKDGKCFWGTLGDALNKCFFVLVQVKVMVIVKPLSYVQLVDPNPSRLLGSTLSQSSATQFRDQIVRFPKSKKHWKKSLSHMHCNKAEVSKVPLGGVTPFAVINKSIDSILQNTVSSTLTSANGKSKCAGPLKTR